METQNVLLVSKICLTFYYIFDFELRTILLGIYMPNSICQYTWVVCETLVCKATLCFENSTWYDDHEKSVEHSTVIVSTGVRTSHINKGKMRVTTIKQIYLTNSGCLPYVPHTETALALSMSHKARSSIEPASTGPLDATPPAGSEWCLHLCYWL